MFVFVSERERERVRERELYSVFGQSAILFSLLSPKSKLAEVKISPIKVFDLDQKNE